MPNENKIIRPKFNISIVCSKDPQIIFSPHPYAKKIEDHIRSAIHKSIRDYFEDNKPEPTEQEKWFALRNKLGEDEAKKELARQLRLAADIVETPGFPDVFGCDIIKQGKKICEDNFIEHVGVTLSFPWPG